jgi:20S proteasome subunit alpha 2
MSLLAELQLTCPYWETRADRVRAQCSQPRCHFIRDQRQVCEKLALLLHKVDILPATNGIVLATEKKSSSPLIDSTSSSKVSLITPNIGMVYSGMGPDYRILVDKARKVSHTGYKRIYNEYPPTRILVQDVARVMQEATQSGGVRPYGVSLLIAGWDDGIEPEKDDADTGETDAEKKAVSGKTGGILKGGPSLYQVDPSGSYFPWKATAIGKSATSAKTFLEKRYTEGLELEDAIHIALLTLKETIEGEMNGETVEIGMAQLRLKI